MMPCSLEEIHQRFGEIDFLQVWNMEVPPYISSFVRLTTTSQETASYL
jgi:hypothetical protein